MFQRIPKHRTHQCQALVDRPPSDALFQELATIRFDYGGRDCANLPSGEIGEEVALDAGLVV
ncbi:MAG: hypothetical protein ACE1Z4_12535 [Gammaproteobacteria bacterium]